MIPRSKLSVQWSLEYAQKSKKLKAKFPATTRGYSITKTARLDDAFSDVSPVEGQSPPQKGKERIKRKGQKKNKKEKQKSKDVGHFLAQKLQILISTHARTASLAHIQPENSPECAKNAFLAKSSGSQWVKDIKN